VSAAIVSAGAKELWYLSRGTGTVALLLLTASVLLGVTTSTRWRSTRWPRFLVNGLHRNLTLLALAFVVVHVVTVIADGFAPIGLLDTIVPLHSAYRPVWLVWKTRFCEAIRGLRLRRAATGEH